MNDPDILALVVERMFDLHSIMYRRTYYKCLPLVNKVACEQESSICTRPAQFH